MNLRKGSQMLSCLLVFKVLVKLQLVPNLPIITWRKAGELVLYVAILSELVLLNNWKWMLLKLNVLSLVIKKRLIPLKLPKRVSIFSKNRNLRLSLLILLVDISKKLICLMKWNRSRLQLIQTVHSSSWTVLLVKLVMIRQKPSTLLLKSVQLLLPNWMVMLEVEEL